MCGMYGFIGTAADGDFLVRCANAAAPRGGHSSGVAWMSSSSGVMTSFRMVGRMRDSSVRMMSGARLALGHERFATTGNPISLMETHPFVMGDLYLMHNGMVARYGELSRRYRDDLVTACDTELLALMVRRMIDDGEPLALAVDYALQAGGGWGAVVAAHGDKVAAVTQEAPLYIMPRGEGDYLCSRDVDETPGRRLIGHETWRVPLPAAEAA